MLTQDQLGSTVKTLLGNLLVFLTGETAITDVSDREALIKSYDRIKSEHGNQWIAGKLQLNPAELEDFNRALRDLGRHQTDDEAGERNGVLVSLRFISWMESLCEQNDGLSFDAEVSPLISEELGRKQVRALELIIRSLINERFGDQKSLEQELAQLLSGKVVAKWKKGADQGDLLSGSSFSELAGLFVNTQEYSNYAPFYAETPFLTYLREKRKTIQNFLEDIRRVRNSLAHNKRVSNTQLSLLDLYYEELVSPVQDAHDQGQTSVNPDIFLDISTEELDDYFNNLHEDIQSVKDDITSLRESIEETLGGISIDAAEIRKTTGTIGQRQKIIGLGVAATVVGISVILWLIFSGNEDTSKIRQTTDRIEQKVEKSADSIEKVAVGIADSTTKITKSLSSIQEGFSSLSKLGGIIDKATRPDELYHNARIYELRGDFLNARKSYEKFFPFNLDVIDPHLRYQGILKAQEGVAAASRIYGKMKPAKPSAAFAAAQSLLLDDQERVDALREVAKGNPSFAPVFYLLSREVSQRQLGQQSLSNKRDEKKVLEYFLKLAKQGAFLKYFIDKKMAGQWLEDAETRLKPLSVVEKEPTKPPFIYTASSSSSGWMLYFNIPEAVRRFSYRLEGDAKFTDAGLQDWIDQRSGTRTAKTSFNMPPNQKDTLIYVKYEDIHGKENGPYRVEFKVMTELVRNQKKTLDLTKNSWLSFRKFNGLLLYFTHLQSYRCAIAKVFYGLNKETPDTRWQGLGKCNPSDPVRLGSKLEIYKKIPTATKFVSVQLTFKDGTQSKIVKIEQR